MGGAVEGGNGGSAELVEGGGAGLAEAGSAGSGEGGHDSEPGDAGGEGGTPDVGGATGEGGSSEDRDVFWPDAGERLSTRRLGEHRNRPGFSEGVERVVEVGRWRLVLTGDRQGLPVWSVVAELELDLHRVTADIDPIAGRQDVRAGDAPVVHEGAVAAAQVFDLHAVAGDADRGVLARDEAVVDDNRAVRASPEQRLPQPQGKSHVLKPEPVRAHLCSSRLSKTRVEFTLARQNYSQGLSSLSDRRVTSVAQGNASVQRAPVVFVQGAWPPTCAHDIAA